jgi:CRISPR/Cas system CMR-associated protein Cmr1 (group 7 of RAMP superfamily)
MGLPIIFHFKDFRSGDPQDNTLEIGGDSDRMASPVITKALVVSETEAYPLLLALRGPNVPQDLVLKQARERDLPVKQGGVDAIEYLLQTAERDWSTKRRILA